MMNMKARTDTSEKEKRLRLVQIHCLFLDSQIHIGNIGNKAFTKEIETATTKASAGSDEWTFLTNMKESIRRGYYVHVFATLLGPSVFTISIPLSLKTRNIQTIVNRNKELWESASRVRDIFYSHYENRVSLNLISRTKCVFYYCKSESGISFPLCEHHLSKFLGISIKLVTNKLGQQRYGVFATRPRYVDYEFPSCYIGQELVRLFFNK